MTAPIFFTATFKGTEYTLNIKQWCILLGRSQTFFYSRMAEAEKKKVPNVMQFIIDQSEYLRAAEKVKPVKVVRSKQKRMSNQDSVKAKKQYRFNESIKCLIFRFIYPENPGINLKMED